MWVDLHNHSRQTPVAVTSRVSVTTASVLCLVSHSRHSNWWQQCPVCGRRYPQTSHPCRHQQVTRPTSAVHHGRRPPQLLNSIHAAMLLMCQNNTPLPPLWVCLRLHARHQILLLSPSGGPPLFVDRQAASLGVAGVGNSPKAPCQCQHLLPPVLSNRQGMYTTQQ